VVQPVEDVEEGVRPQAASPIHRHGVLRHRHARRRRARSPRPREGMEWIADHRQIHCTQVEEAASRHLRRTSKYKLGVGNRPCVARGTQNLN
jgi:hypothetical protein